MNDLELAAGLRSRSPDALPELLDAYGNRIFGYCWRLLANRQNAQAAVRDALIIAAGQAGRLARDEWLGPWLYCLARAECRRRAAVPASGVDECAVGPDRRDAGRRLMAWNAVASMNADEVEALELACRHEVDLSLVLSLSPAEVAALLDRARQNLQLAVAAQVLIGSLHACPDRAESMRGWTGIATPPIRDRVLEHAATCPACGPRRPRNVSAARVFGLLPAPELSSLARLEVLVFFADPRMWAYREFVAGRAAELTGSVFLTEPGASGPGAAPLLTASEPGAAPEPAQNGPCVAQGFIGSWQPAAPEPPAAAPEPPAAPDAPDPLSIPPARWAAPAPRPSARKSPPATRRPGWRRYRISRLGVAAAVGVAITVAAVLVGLRPAPAPARVGRPAASTSRPASATAQPPTEANAAAPGRRPATGSRRVRDRAHGRRGRAVGPDAAGSLAVLVAPAQDLAAPRNSGAAGRATDNGRGPPHHRDTRPGQDTNSRRTWDAKPVPIARRQRDLGGDFGLSWTGDGHDPFAHRPGPAGPPD